MADNVTVTYEDDTVLVTYDDDNVVVVSNDNEVVTVVSVAEQGPPGLDGLSSPATTTTLGGIIVGDNLSINANGLLSAQAVGNYVPKISNVTYGNFTQQSIQYIGETSTAVTNSGTITRNLFAGYSQPPYPGLMVFGSNATSTAGVATTASMQVDGQIFTISGTNAAGDVTKESGMGFSGTGVQFSYFEDNPDGYKTVEYLLSSTGIRITSINNNYTSSVFGDTTFEVTPVSTFITTLEPDAITPNTIMNKQMTESLFITMRRMGL